MTEWLSYNAFFLERNTCMTDIELTRHLAELSKITFTENELEKMTSDMKNIIEVMDKVRKFHADIEPHTLDAVRYDDLREDIVSPSFPTEKITENAAEIADNCFTVPKVVQQ